MGWVGEDYKSNLVPAPLPWTVTQKSKRSEGASENSQPWAAVMKAGDCKTLIQNSAFPQGSTVEMDLGCC